MVSATAGKMQDYISNIEFSLNFEDKSSVKIKIGQIIQYDGLTAKYKNPAGLEFIGRTTSLQSAISSNWLTLNVNGAKSAGTINAKVDNVRKGVSLKKSEDIPLQDPKYNPLTGGNFDQFIQKENHIIAEEDRIVKKSKKEVTDDQVSVKETGSSVVGSSTATSKGVKAHSTKILRGDSYNADSSTPIRPIGNRNALSDKKEVTTFTVDDTTPRVSDEATLKEIQRVTKPVVKDAESQDAKVIKKISKISTQVEHIEGVTLKSSVKNPDDTDVDVSVKVSSGSTPIADLSGINTQEQANKVSGEIKSQYLDKLPEDWSKMHWVKKEQFIQQQSDKEFIKFILTVDTTKAIQNACRKRLLELEKLAMSK